MVFVFGSSTPHPHFSRADLAVPRGGWLPVRRSRLEGHEDHGPRLEALAWIQTQTAEDARIGVHRRKDGWYAQRRVLVVSTPTDERDLFKKMASLDVDYLVFDVHRLARHMPHWLEGDVLDEVRRFGEPGQDGEVIVFARSTVGD